MMNIITALLIVVLFVPSRSPAQTAPCPKTQVRLFDLCAPVSSWVRDALTACRSGESAACQTLGFANNVATLQEIDSRSLKRCATSKPIPECAWLDEVASAEPRNIVFQIAKHELALAKCQAGDPVYCGSLDLGWVLLNSQDFWLFSDSFDARVLKEWTKCCDRGLVYLCEKIAGVYRGIQDDPQQQRLADKYLQKACTLGSDSSCQERTVLHLTSENETGVFSTIKGLELARLHCNQGSEEACFALGVYWARAKHLEKTTKAFSRACTLSQKREKIAKDKAAADCHNNPYSFMCVDKGLHIPNGQAYSRDQLSTSTNPNGPMNGFCLASEEVSCFQGSTDACARLVANRKPTCNAVPSNPVDIVNNRAPSLGCPDSPVIRQGHLSTLIKKSIEKCLPPSQSYEIMLILGHGNIVGIQSIQWISGDTNLAIKEEDARGCIGRYLESPRSYNYYPPSQDEVFVALPIKRSF